jgi:hypothetical protein
MNYNSNGHQFPQPLKQPVSEGIYNDDTRNVKRPKIEPKRNSLSTKLTLAPTNTPKEIAPKPVLPKVLS